MWVWLCVFRSSPRLWHSESFCAEERNPGLFRSIWKILKSSLLLFTGTLRFIAYILNELDVVAEELTKELTKDEQDQKQKKVLLNKKGDEQ